MIEGAFLLAATVLQYQSKGNEKHLIFVFSYFIELKCPFSAFVLHFISDDYQNSACLKGKMLHMKFFKCCLIFIFKL